MAGPSSAVLLALIPQLPMFVVYLAGVALAASFARQLEKAALMAGIGFGLLILSWLVSAGTQYWMITMPRDMIRGAMGMVFALTWLREGAALAGMIFLLVAIFARRAGPRAA